MHLTFNENNPDKIQSVFSNTHEYLHIFLKDNMRSQGLGKSHVCALGFLRPFSSGESWWYSHLNHRWKWHISSIIHHLAQHGQENPGNMSHLFQLQNRKWTRVASGDFCLQTQKGCQGRVEGSTDTGNGVHWCQEPILPPLFFVSPSVFSDVLFWALFYRKFLSMLWPRWLLAASAWHSD